MSLASALRSFWPRPDPRTPREIEDQIAAEIEFHLAEATDEIAGGGVERVEARRVALARFGNVERIRAECRRAQMGGSAMAVKILAGVVAVLVVLLVLLGSLAFVSYRRARFEMERARAAEMQARADAESTIADMRSLVESARAERIHSLDAEEEAGSRSSIARLLNANSDARSATERVRDWFQADPDNWRVGLSAAQRIASEFEPAVAAEIVRELYPYLSVAHREQLFKPFVFDGGHPMALAILDLGARDSEGSVRERAYIYLRNYAFHDFSADADAYDEWCRSNAGVPLAEVFDRSARAAADRLRSLQGGELAQEMRVLSELDLAAARKHGTDVARSFRAAGMEELVSGWLASAEQRDVVFALRAASWLDLDARAHAQLVDGALARDWKEPQPLEVANEYCCLVGARGNDWAVERLLDIASVGLSQGDDESATFAPCGALANIGDTRAIPRLVELLQRHDTAAARYSIGYYALRPLTGVSHDASHDAEWWTLWWEKNRTRFEK